VVDKGLEGFCVVELSELLDSVVIGEDTDGLELDSIISEEIGIFVTKGSFTSVLLAFFSVYVMQ